MDRNEVGQAGLSGWRKSLADTVASPVARRTSMSSDDVRAAVGAMFLILSIIYLGGAVRRIVRNT